MRGDQAPRVIPLGSEPEPMAGRKAQSKSPPTRGKGNPTKSTTGRFQSINTFVDYGMDQLTRAELTAWLILWRDVKPNGIATTSQTDIARRAGMSDRSVRTAIGQLEAKGYLVRVRQGGLRRGPSAYRVCCPVEAKQS
jgi:hypothetical protein